MSKKRYVVELSAAEREHLNGLISKGKAAARTLLKARILLKADAGPLGEGWTDGRIIEALDTNEGMVYRVRAGAICPPYAHENQVPPQLPCS